MTFGVRWFLPLVVVLAACDSGSAQPAPAPAPAPPRPPSVAESAGKITYGKLCAPCHGVEGKGYAADHSPSLVSATFLETATDDFIRRSIIAGRPGTSMGAYGKALGGPLDDASVDQIVRFLRGTAPQPVALAAVNKGDPAKGAPLYTEHCKTCHGDATTRGEAPHLANLQFQKLASDSFVRYAIEKGRPGTKMVAFGPVLKPAQLDDVVAYVRALGSAGPGAVNLLPAPTGKEPLVLNPKGKDPVWAPRENRFISVDDVHKALAAKRRMIIIDARPPSEWMQVHIEGAVSIPYHDMKRLDDVPKDVYVIAYCACPHHLSGIVVDELVKRGYKKALVLDEGINVWHQRKYPVTAAPGVTPPVNEPPAQPRGGL
ncbi:MAG: Cytochrome c oxidase subunit CcoP [Deltaproteobacteria bacterium]|nr:Cytochrome c oxidase subunit CcoP [Deltaproteobacteria bacterium]